MHRMMMAALSVGCLLLASSAFAGEDPKQRPREDKDKPAQTSKPAVQQRQFDVDEFMQKYDKSKRGYLTRDDLPANMRTHFDELDTNKDGKLSREELLQHAARMQALCAERKPSSRRGESTVLPAMILLGVKIASSDEPGRECAQVVYDILRAMDTQNNGKIDPAAWDETMDMIGQGMQNLREHRVDRLVERYGDKDGRISKENARGRVKRMFSKWDTNGDGYIDRNELRRAFHLEPLPERSTVPTSKPNEVERK